MGEQKRRREASGSTGGDWETTRFNSGNCLHCNSPLTGPAERPNKGALMVCGDCGYVAEWDGEKNVECSEATMAEASADPDVAKVLAVTRMLRELRVNPKRVIMLEGREPEICEDCGKLDELRPSFDERIEGENPV